MTSNQDLIKSVEAAYANKKIPDFNVGDTVSVHVKIVEDEKSRTQIFEGIVISKRGTGARASFTVRKISFGEGVERSFPLYSPIIEKITVTKKGSVIRAKLYYLRQKVGKATKVEEKIGAESQTKDALPREEGKKEGV